MSMYLFSCLTLKFCFYSSFFYLFFVFVVIYRLHKYSLKKYFFQSQTVFVVVFNKVLEKCYFKQKHKINFRYFKLITYVFAKQQKKEI